jgi:hypothetical protein
VVPRRHAVGAAMPSSELSGLARARRGAVVPQGRGPRREASPASLWAARAMHAGRAGAVPLAASGFGPLAFVFFSIFKIYSNSCKVQKFVSDSFDLRKL